MKSSKPALRRHEAIQEALSIGRQLYGKGTPKKALRSEAGAFVGFRYVLEALPESAILPALADGYDCAELTSFERSFSHA